MKSMHQVDFKPSATYPQVSGTVLHSFFYESEYFADTYQDNFPVTL